MIDDIKDKLTDNEYLMMYNKLRDMKKLHDKTVEEASTARLGQSMGRLVIRFGFGFRFRFRRNGRRVRSSSN